MKIRLFIAFSLILVFGNLSTFAQDAAWSPSIDTLQEYETLSVEDSSRQDLLRTTKFLAPAHDDPSLLDTVYQNVNRYQLHLEFMVSEFPERFAGLTPSEYMDMVLEPETRSYYAGAIFQFQDRQGNILYGFNIYSTPTAPPQMDEIQVLYNKLAQSMTLRPFAYSPITNANIESAKQWESPGFPIYLPEGLIEPEYEAYSPSANYGRVRMFALNELGAAVENGQIGWQDIVVVDRAPTDIETVVAGIVTGTRQGELSHVNVRSLRRGTPNAYIQNPLQTLKEYEGELIKLSVDNDRYSIEYPVELSDAEAWWSEHRPRINALKTPDDIFDELVSLEDMQNLEFVDSLTQRFGGKASQLGVLYSVMGGGLLRGETDIPYLVDGFGIPFHYYREFMQSNLIPHPSDSQALVTYEEYIQVLIEDPQFRSDTAYRANRLNYFIDYMRDRGEVDPDLVAKIVAKIIEVYGSYDVKVRFRSSSNAEDDILFNGAGLYDSTSVCAQDSLDDDDQGPSHCDSSQNKERTIERGLKKVWASLWKPIAFEERDYYQIDHVESRMGILVSRAYPAEDCNGVAFTGDPITGRKDIYIINVQQGDESVVQPGTGIIPEKDLINWEMGFYPTIERVRQSSIMPEGEWVLSEDQLHEIAGYLQQIDMQMPVDTGDYRRDQVFFDIEFKYDNQQFVIKQIRPTLMNSATQPPVEIEEVVMSIPENTQLAANFNMQRTIREEYDVHSIFTLKSGRHSLPLESGRYELDLIESFKYGPTHTLIEPKSPGIIHVEKLDPPENGIVYRYQYEQTYLLNNKDFTLTIQGFQIVGENKSRYELVFDNELIVNSLSAIGMPEGGEYQDQIPYKIPTDDRGNIKLNELELENGQRIRLYENIRYRVMGTGFTYAYFVYADLDLNGGKIVENDYWNLIYTAKGHCWDAKFWVIFDEPIGDAYGLALLTTTMQWGAYTEGEVYLLDENMEHLRQLEIVSYTKEPVEKLPDGETPVSNWFMY